MVNNINNNTSSIIINDNMYNNNERSTTTILPTTFYTILPNTYYRGILYLMYVKGWTYLNDIKKLYPINAGQYILLLMHKGVIREGELTKERREFILTTNKHIGKSNADRVKVYELTPSIRAILNNPNNYEMLVSLLSDRELDFYSKQKEQYQLRKQELEEKQKTQLLEEEHRRKIIELKKKNGLL